MRYFEAESVIALLKAHAKDGDNRTFISDETAYAIENMTTIEVEGGDLDEAVLLTKDAYSDLCQRASQVSEDTVSKRYLLAEIDDLADEFSEVDENGLHSERWCGIMDSKLVILNAPSVVPTTE